MKKTDLIKVKPTIAIVYRRLPITHEHYAHLRALIRTLRKQFTVKKPEEADLIVVIGGDGYMTEMMKKLVHLGKPFYGINRGTFGFLLNDHANDDYFVLDMAHATFIDFPIIEADVYLETGEVRRVLAFNEIYTKTSNAQAAKHRVRVDGKNLLAEWNRDLYVGDGIIVTTPGGSTAYNLAAGGEIIFPEHQDLVITPSNPFLPTRSQFHSKRFNGKEEIELEMVENNKRHHLVVADNIVFRHVLRVFIRRSTLTVRVGFKTLDSYYRKLVQHLGSARR